MSFIYAIRILKSTKARKGIGALGLELQTALSHHVGAENSLRSSGRAVHVFNHLSSSDFELLILLPLPLECWHCEYAPPLLASAGD